MQRESERAVKTVEMTRAAEPTDECLLARMMAGDEDAFTLLYRRRHPALYRFALHVSGNASVAEDVTQEVFMALIRDAGRYDPARGTLNGFLFGIARNHLRKRWENEQRFVAIGDDLESLTPLLPSNGNGGGADSGGIFRREPIERLRRAIATLPGEYREVVALCELGEMSYDEAADTLDCPIGTVRSRLHRARKLLTEKLTGRRKAPQPLTAVLPAKRGLP